MKALAIILMCVVAAVCYGLAHNQVTARICLEYFTIGHPRLFAHDSPTLHGLAWAVIATWWMGLGLGIPIAAAARAGSEIRLPVIAMIRPICVLLVVMACAASAAGIFGCALAHAGVLRLIGPIGDAVPVHRHHLFIANLWAHWASYIFGALGGIALTAHTWRRRRHIVQR